MNTDLSSSDLLDADPIADPYPIYRRLQDQAPVWQMPGTEIYIVTSFALVAEATARVDDFSSNMQALLYRGEGGQPERLSFGDVGVQTLATADPPDHTLHRTTVFPELVATRMAMLEPEIGEITAGALDRTLADGSVDFMMTVGNFVPIRVIARLINFRDSEPDVLLRAAFESTEILSSTLTLPRLETLIAGIGEIEAWIADQLVAAQAEPGDDILGSVARGVSNGTFGLHEGTVILHTLLSAGGESTTSLLGSATRILAEDADLQDRLRNNRDLVSAFIEEALRLESPFRYLMRSVHADTRLGDITIPAGASVLLFWGAANRDADEFDHPDEVDLERRALRHHVAFGRGIHHCVGAPLARLEAKIVLGAILERTAGFSLDADDPPVWVDSLLIRRYERLPLRLTGS
jgi:cytochrome P450